MSRLFSPLKLRNVDFKNRVFVSPMCQYSSESSMPEDWHFVHLGSRAIGGAALVLTEATAVSPEGRISPRALGIWSDSLTFRLSGESPLSSNPRARSPESSWPTQVERLLLMCHGGVGTL